jgi:hypothetical protein
VNQAFTLRNSGSATTSALKIGMSGSSTFTKTMDTCTGTSLGPAKSCSVTITFAPASSSQSYKATLTATNNKPFASDPGLAGGGVHTCARQCAGDLGPGLGPARRAGVLAAA